MRQFDEILTEATTYDDENELSDDTLIDINNILSKASTAISKVRKKAVQIAKKSGFDEFDDEFDNLLDDWVSASSEDTLNSIIDGSY